MINAICYEVILNQLWGANFYQRASLPQHLAIQSMKQNHGTIPAKNELFHEHFTAYEIPEVLLNLLQ